MAAELSNAFCGGGATLQVGGTKRKAQSLKDVTQYFAPMYLGLKWDEWIMLRCHDCVSRYITFK